jgi:hypothetical protein
MTLASRMSDFENMRSTQFRNDVDVVPAKRGESFENLAAISKSNIERSLAQVIERYETTNNKKQRRG